MNATYSLKNNFGQDSLGNYSATIVITYNKEITWRTLINALRDLAQQLKEEHKDDGDEGNYFDEEEVRMNKLTLAERWIFAEGFRAGEKSEKVLRLVNSTSTVGKMRYN